MKILRSVLPVLALLSLSAFAQNQTWTVVLTAVGSNQCLPLQTETINGQPFDLSKGAGLSMEICPNYYINSGQNGYIFIQVPPTQPWAPDGSWYQWFPSPYTTPSQITRGPLVPTSNPLIVTETDSFTYTVDFTFYRVWVQSWQGTLTRTLQKIPCRRYCDGDSDDFTLKELSDTAVLTGNFPVPSAP